MPGPVPQQTFPQQFVSGHANSFQWQILGQSNQTLNVTASTWDEEINAIDVTHSGSGGVEARLANILRGRGTVNADFDLLAPPYLNPPQILSGFSGIGYFYVSPTRNFQIPSMILKVHWENPILGKVSYSFDIGLNSLAGQYIRPTT